MEKNYTMCKRILTDHGDFFAENIDFLKFYTAGIPLNAEFFDRVRLNSKAILFITIFAHALKVHLNDKLLVFAIGICNSRVNDP